MVEVKILGGAAEKVGTRRLEEELEEPVSLEELLDTDGLDLGQYILLLNGQPAEADSEISDDDQVVIMPRIGGG